jgi:acetyl esterase/lipase
MPSTRAYLTSWIVWALYYRRKRASEEQLLAGLRDRWRGEFDKEVIPPFIHAASNTIDVKEEVFQSEEPNRQKWKVFHCAIPPDSDVVEGDKVVIYWHGGAFMNGVSTAELQVPLITDSVQAADRHWSVCHRLVRDHHLPVVFPQYTRAPLGTADAWCRAALELTLEIASDPRYKDKRIVHMGDSAGGWMALRFRMLLCGLILGEETISGMELDQERLKALQRRMGPAVLISPVVNFEETDALREKEALVRVDLSCSRTWLTIRIPGSASTYSRSCEGYG